jgi:hypothetical protein
MLDFRIATFLTVCRTMNFTKAAEELGLTQPAVTQHIHHLEQHYGISLFRYEKKALSLTRQGKLLYAGMNAMTKDEEILKKELLRTPEEPPFLSIGVTLTIGEYAVLSPLAAYIEHHPNINLHVHYGNTRNLLALLDDGQISLALIEGFYPEKRYGHRPYRTEQFICACAADYVFSGRQPNRLRDLFGERLLLREAGSGTREILERSLQARGLSLSDFPRFVVVENMHALIRMMKQTCGISFLYRVAVQEELERGTLREIPLSDFSMQHTFDFVWDQNSIYADQAMALSEALLSHPNARSGAFSRISG